jgi:Fe-Mn family superoxide dismutase
MAFELKPLPYSHSALAPVISAQALQIHFSFHYASYVSTLNLLTQGNCYGYSKLESLVTRGKMGVKERQIFNNAAQVWNHEFFWQSMAPAGSGEPPERVRRLLTMAFGSIECFRTLFVETAANLFSSGWIWLVASPSGELNVLSTSDADNPMTRGYYPLLACDVWEHAYYLDYQQKRAQFVRAVLDQLVNWRHVEDRLKQAHVRCT